MINWLWSLWHSRKLAKSAEKADIIVEDDGGSKSCWMLVGISPQWKTHILCFIGHAIAFDTKTEAARFALRHKLGDHVEPIERRDIQKLLWFNSQTSVDRCNLELLRISPSERSFVGESYKEG